MKKQIKHAIILLGGLGTRFLPITKSLPKAMLPIIDRPCFEFLIREAYEAGITKITLVLGPGMEMIRDYIEPKRDWENTLKTRGFEAQLKHWDFYRHLTIQWIVQENPLGDGDAILRCHEMVKQEEAFAILFGDDLVFHEKGALTQLIEAYQSKPAHTLAVIAVQKEEVSSYGIIATENSSDESILVTGLVEKPRAEDAPSNLAIIGKYIVTNSIWKQLEIARKNHEKEARPEFRLIEALELDREAGQSVFAQKIEGMRFDTGSKKGWLEANCFIAGR